MSEVQNRRLPPEEMSLPPPSAELVLLRVAVESFLANSKPKDADRFLRHMAATLASEESVAELLPIRPSSQHAAQRKARREAVAMFKQMLLPVWLARVPRR